MEKEIENILKRQHLCWWWEEINHGKKKNEFREMLWLKILLKQ